MTKLEEFFMLYYHMPQTTQKYDDEVEVAKIKIKTDINPCIILIIGILIGINIK